MSAVSCQEKDVSCQMPDVSTYCVEYLEEFENKGKVLVIGIKILGYEVIQRIRSVD